MNILFIAPFTANGGIASWAQNFYKNYNDLNFQLFPIDSSSNRRKPTDTSIVKRVVYGLLDLLHLYKATKSTLKKGNYSLIHTTTSGHIGCFRDFVICRLAKKYNCKTILHCHYGCISYDLYNKKVIGFLTRTAFNACDQIWVLDKHSYNTLKQIPNYNRKVHLTPNPIDIKYEFDSKPKEYKTIAFLGNMIPTKGLFELIHAVNKCNIRLDIIGPGTDEVVEKVKKLSGDNFNKSIFIHGKVPNNEALALLKNIDILALPTYYPFEAFPISILEAMSLSKLVISTERAAIPDMLTAVDGSKCGILIKEKSIDDIVNAITYCQENPKEADKMCEKAYEKVKKAYSKDVVYKIYTNNYKVLFNTDICQYSRRKSC